MQNVPQREYFLEHMVHKVCFHGQMAAQCCFLAQMVQERACLHGKIVPQRERFHGIMVPQRECFLAQMALKRICFHGKFVHKE